MFSLIMFNKSKKVTGATFKHVESASEKQQREDTAKMNHYHAERLEKFYNDACDAYAENLQERVSKAGFQVGDKVLLNTYVSNSWRGGPKQYLEYVKIPFDTVFTILKVTFDTYWMTDTNFAHCDFWYKLQDIYDKIKDWTDKDVYDTVYQHVSQYYQGRQTDAIGWVYSVEPVSKTNDRRPWGDASEEVLIYADGIGGSKYKRLLKLITQKENMKAKLKEIESSISNLEHDEAIRTRR